MPATTPNLSIPYPLAADSVASYPALAKQQAEKIEALVYDSGWVGVPLASGITAQGGLAFEVRRIGSAVYPRWGISGTGIAASTTTTIATIPAGFRPARSFHAVAATNSSVVARYNVEATGVMTLTTSASTGTYYIFQTPWLIG